MTIIRVNHNKDNPYVMLNKSALECCNLSWAAKGMWAYLMSRPDNWKVSAAQLTNIYLGDKRGNAKEGVLSILNELISEGYAAKEKTREKGKFSTVDYVIHEKKLKKSSPQRVQPDTVQPAPVKTALISNDKEQVMKRTNVRTFSLIRCEEPPCVPLEDDIEKIIPLDWVQISKPNKSFVVTEHFLKKLAPLEKILTPEELAQFGKYPTENIEKAIKYCTDPEFKPTKSLVASIHYYAKNPEHIPKAKEDIVKKNMKSLSIDYNRWKKDKTFNTPMNSNSLLMRSTSHYYLDCTQKGVHIVPFGTGKEEIILWTEKGFNEQLESMMRKKGFNV